MELAARTLVKLGQLPGSKGVESFEYDIKQAFEFISEERNEVSFGCTYMVKFILICLFLFNRVNDKQP